MTKSINTLVRDIQQVIDTGGGWDETLSKYAAGLMEDTFNQRLIVEEHTHEPSLRMSAMGTPCKRKLWYSVNAADESESLSASSKFKFLYGDILEQLLIALAKAAGHKVEGVQDTLEINGIKGHRDLVVDGVTVDIKSASSFAFKKFANGSLRDDDPFGYISQLSSYVYAGRDSEVESHPTLGAFLVVDKQNGFICLDMYDFGPELKRKEEEFQEIQDMVKLPEPPDKAFEPVPTSKKKDKETGKMVPDPDGNLGLGTQCSYCSFKHKCWPDMRTFQYSSGPKHLVKVVKEPQVKEIFND